MFHLQREMQLTLHRLGGDYFSHWTLWSLQNKHKEDCAVRIKIPITFLFLIPHGVVTNYKQGFLVVLSYLTRRVCSQSLVPGRMK